MKGKAGSAGDRPCRGGMELLHIHIWMGRRRTWGSGFPASAHLPGTAKALSFLAGGPEPAGQRGMWAGESRVFGRELRLIPPMPRRSSLQ